MTLSNKQKRFLDKELRRIKKQNLKQLQTWRKQRAEEIKKRRKNENR